MKRTAIALFTGCLCLVASLSSTAVAQRPDRAAAGQDRSDFPKFEDVAKGHQKIISSAGGDAGMYTLYKDKNGHVLAELPRNFGNQKVFIAFTIKGGIPTAGVQYGDMYAYWKMFGKRLALVEPNYETRTSGDAQSRSGLDRVYTDRVILDIPIVSMGPSGGPVIDLSSLLVDRASSFFGGAIRGSNTKLAKTMKAKSFPKNVELAFEMPLSGGQFGTIYYSIAEIPEKTGYTPRVADERIGYFVTGHTDIGNPSADTPRKRYINRWHLQKADPSLQMSPPKQPIVFYIEHTAPVRYRRWIREGILEWNKAFEQVGIVNAIEVYQQDEATGAHMEKDPEDARYNFVLWTNAGMGFAIGPSRVHPKTGQILDADIVMDEGFITGWIRQWENLIPQTAMENFGPETLAWLESRPEYDPRIRLVDPANRQQVEYDLVLERAQLKGVSHPAFATDPTLLGDEEYDGLVYRVSQINGSCQHCAVKAMDMAFFRLNPGLFEELSQSGRKGRGKGKPKKDEETKEEDSPAEKEQMLDGVPESYIGPMLRDVIMHEVGHTLGLRHNFKGSTIYSMEEINQEEFKGQAHAGSVMDYMPANINMDDGPVQGDYTMVTIGPYDYWAIEYGYTTGDTKKVLSRVAEPHLIYATDEDTGGPDPRARRFDHGANPLDYSESQLRLVDHFRGRILDDMVDDGESWSKARKAYELLLNKHVAAISIASNWIGGSYVNRDKKGDPNARTPVTPVEADQQRRAMQIVLDNTMYDEAFGLSPKLLQHMTVDRWFDGGGRRGMSEEAWPVHARISGIQASALSQLMNPTTMNRVYDNEFRADADMDVITVPEILSSVHETVWSEIDGAPDRMHDARDPYISSLRRNLQREYLDRLIDMSMPNNGFRSASVPVRDLSRNMLWQLGESLPAFLDAHENELDPYTDAHLRETLAMIDRAMDAQYIYNASDISGGGPITITMPGRGSQVEEAKD